MRRLLWPALAVLVLAVLAAGCEPIRPPGKVDTPLKRVVMPSDQEIPRDFGRFIGATTSEHWPGWGQLYFEEPETGLIRVVFVSFTDRTLERKVIVIPRGAAPAVPEGRP